MFFKKSRPKVTASMAVSLTEAGRREAEQYTSKGPKFAILAALSERSPMSVGELVEETQIDISELRVWAQRLANEGYVRFMAGMGMEN